MNRQGKQAVIDAMRTNFSESRASFLVGVQGVTVDRMQKFRRSVLKEGGQVNVVKNTLLDIAVNECAGVKSLQPYFEHQIAVVFAFQEPTAVAKAIYESAKMYEQLKIIAGYVEGSVINSDKVQYLATLPPREVLASQVCGGLKAPIANHVMVLKALLRQFVWVLKQASEKNA